MADDLGYRGQDGFLKLLDLSKWPTANDRLQKLGNFLQTFGAVVIFSSEGSAATAQGLKIGDTQIKPKLSHWPFEPDAINLRLHDPNGKDNVYDVGLILDNVNPSSGDQDRTTIFKDQGKVITYALPTDLMRISQRLAAVVGQSMNLNGAGFPSLVCPELLGNGLGTRGAVSLNVSRNLGFAGDTVNLGQLAHLVCFPPGNGKTSVAGGVEKPTELLLRADMGIRFGKQVGRFMNEPDGDASEGSASDEKRLVKLFLDTPAPPDDGLDTSEDGLSNHERIPKDVPKFVIHGVVRVPKGDPTTPWPTPSPTPTYAYSYHGTPPGKTPGSGGGSGVASGGEKLPTITDRDLLSSEPSVVLNKQDNPKAVDQLAPTHTGKTYTDGNGKKYVQITTPGGLTIWVADDGDAPSTTLPHADATTQVQQGHLPAQSPAFSQRANFFRFHKTKDVAGVYNLLKAPGITTVQIAVDVKLSRLLAAHEWIFAEVILSTRDKEGNGPTKFYGLWFAFDQDSVGVDRNWHTLCFTFRGFPTQEQFIEVYNSRSIYDAGGGTESRADATMYIDWNRAASLDYSTAPFTRRGYGSKYGSKYGLTS